MGTGADAVAAAPASRVPNDLIDARLRPVAGTERWWQVVTAATLIAIAICTARALVRGYLPLEDNAVTGLRATDVFSAHPPLVGMVSSASQQGGPVAHPGPLQLDLLAPFVRLLPPAAGLAVGTAAVNGAAIAAMAWSARRFLGSLGAALVAGVAAVLVWSLGSEAVLESWQPIAALLPFLCGLVATWGVATGDDALAAVAVVALTFAVQTHGSYLLLVPVVVVAGVVLRLLRRRDGVTLGRRPLAVAGGAALLLWAQPLVDQFLGSGNLSRLWRHAVGGDSSGDDGVLGVGDAMRVVASVLVRPPMWTRGGVASGLPLGDGGQLSAGRGAFDTSWLPLSWSIVGLGVLMGLLVAVAALALRRRDPVVVAGGVLAMVIVAGAVVSAAGLPVDAFGFSPHRVRWLWVIGAFVTSVLLVAALRLGVVANRRDAVAAVVLIAVVATVATVPTSNQLLSPQQFLVDRYDAVRRLEDVAEQFEGLGVVYLNTLGRPLPDPYNDAFAAAMVRAGIDVRVAGEYSALQYGTHRRLADGSDAADVTAHVFVGSFPEGLPPPYGEVARFADGLRVVVVGAAFGTVRGRPG